MTRQPNHKLIPLESNDSWRDYAACRDSDPDLFYPVGTTGPAIEQIEAAKAICRTCEVQVQCLDYALTIREPEGIWGGFDEKERRSMVRRRSASVITRKAISDS